MKHIYLLSGLGVDDRVFEKIVFPYPHTFIKWMLPLVQETMQAYAKRLSEQITHANPILIGLSFGGMMSIEIAKIINGNKLKSPELSLSLFTIPFICSSILY